MKVRVVWADGGKTEIIECASWGQNDNAVRFYDGKSTRPFCIIPLQNVLSFCQIKEEPRVDKTVTPVV